MEVERSIPVSVESVHCIIHVSVELRTRLIVATNTALQLLDQPVELISIHPTISIHVNFDEELTGCANDGSRGCLLGGTLGKWIS